MDKDKMTELAAELTKRVAMMAADLGVPLIGAAAVFVYATDDGFALTSGAVSDPSVPKVREMLSRILMGTKDAACTMLEEIGADPAAVTVERIMDGRKVGVA
jgi:hypothetical protein